MVRFKMMAILRVTSRIVLSSKQCYFTSFIGIYIYIIIYIIRFRACCGMCNSYTNALMSRSRSDICFRFLWFFWFYIFLLFLLK